MGQIFLFAKYASSIRIALPKFAFPSIIQILSKMEYTFIIIY